MLIFLCANAYSEETTVYEAVYYDDLPGENHFNNINDAINNVSDNGTIYVGKDICIYSSNSPIQVNKSLQLVSINPSTYKVKFYDLDKPAFNLNSTEYFKLNGIGAIGGRGKVLTGSCSNIEINNCSFESCNSLYIIQPNGSINISVNNSHFIDSNIYVDTKGYTGNIELADNNFERKNYSSNEIVLTDMDVSAHDNAFTDTIFRLQGALQINGNISNNVFDGAAGKIYITAEGNNIHFNFNKIVKEISQEVYYTGQSIIDFTKNWWNDKEGPDDYRIDGNIDYGNWALFEDFSRFSDDPYTLDDLRQAIEKIGLPVDDTIWIYDMNGDGVIEFVDLVWITRIIRD